MHLVQRVVHTHDYQLLLAFEDGSVRLVDLQGELEGEVFEPLKDADRFGSVRVDHDLDTIVWDNGADMSPDYLYELGVPVADSTTVTPQTARRSRR